MRNATGEYSLRVLILMFLKEFSNLGDSMIIFLCSCNYFSSNVFDKMTDMKP